MIDQETAFEIEGKDFGRDAKMRFIKTRESIAEPSHYMWEDACVSDDSKDT